MVELLAVNVTLTYPGERQVEIVEGQPCVCSSQGLLRVMVLYTDQCDVPFRRFVASLKEEPVSGDPTSNRSDIVPTFVGYAPAGNVTAETIYANYGRKEDFEYLEVGPRGSSHCN